MALLASGCFCLNTDDFIECSCLVSILFADVLVNTAIPTSNIIFVNVFLLFFPFFLLNITCFKLI